MMTDAPAAATMAATAKHSDDKNTLMRLPLELRHRIYGFCSQRQDGPNNLLKEWFEMEDPQTQQTIQQAMADFTAAAANGTTDGGDQGDESEEDDDEDDGDGDGDDQGEEDEDNENAEEEEDGDDEETEDADTNGDGNDATATATTTVGATTTTTNTDAIARPTSIAGSASLHPVFRRPHTKYRHSPAIISITHCPPPTEILRVNKGILGEVLEYHYSTCILNINVTQGFQHQSFFEELMDILINKSSTNATITPLARIRRVELNIVWDTLWVQTKSNNGEVISDIWTFMLSDRINKAINVLAGIPSLKKVTIHWHDTTDSEEGGLFKDEVLFGEDSAAMQILFAMDNIDVEVIDHFTPNGTKINKKSLVGKKRNEFESILAGGQQFI